MSAPDSNMISCKDTFNSSTATTVSIAIRYGHTFKINSNQISHTVDRVEGTPRRSVHKKIILPAS